MGIQWDRNEIAMVLPGNGRAPSLCPCWSGKPSRTGAWNCLLPPKCSDKLVAISFLSCCIPIIPPLISHYIYIIVITTPWYTSFISHYTSINSPIHCNPMSKIPWGFLCHGRTPSSHPLVFFFPECPWNKPSSYDPPWPAAGDFHYHAARGTRWGANIQGSVHQRGRISMSIMTKAWYLGMAPGLKYPMHPMRWLV